MASENETVKSIIANARKEIDYGEGVLLHLTGKRANEIFDSIESAWRREKTEMCRRESALRTELKIAEGALDEMLGFYCLNCPKRDDMNCRCMNSGNVHKWRKALAAIREEGGANA